jgi:hypothetical protein
MVGKSKSKGVKKQKIIFQKGCSRKHLGGKHKCSKKCRLHYSQSGGCGGSCPLQHGGSCESCGSQKGGWTFKTGLDPVPGPFVGGKWTDYTKGNENYYANNLYDKGDPQTMMKLNGGSSNKGSSKQRSYKKRTHKKWGKSRKVVMRGGNLIPQQLTNLGRDLSFSFKSAYNNMNGYSAPVNPAPYKDQFNTKYSNIIL